mmetsp:Transcript_23403/g.41977  ORF Transcript_23403/g.41977 Transcript_23403/m.41977 type:complete len:209 (-) Transcript_23403:588-1214(-)
MFCRTSPHSFNITETMAPKMIFRAFVAGRGIFPIVVTHAIRRPHIQRLRRLYQGRNVGVTFQPLDRMRRVREGYASYSGEQRRVLLLVKEVSHELAAGSRVGEDENGPSQGYYSSRHTISCDALVVIIAIALFFLQDALSFEQTTNAGLEGVHSEPIPSSVRINDHAVHAPISRFAQERQGRRRFQPRRHQVTSAEDSRAYLSFARDH